jgi:hypothetical protein
VSSDLDVVNITLILISWIHPSAKYKSKDSTLDIKEMASVVASTTAKALCSTVVGTSPKALEWLIIFPDKPGVVRKISFHPLSQTRMMWHIYWH